MQNGILMKLNPNSWDQDFTFTFVSPASASIVTSGTYDAGTLPLVTTILQNPSYLSFIAAADESANTFTVNFYDVNQRLLSVSFSGPNATTYIFPYCVAQVVSISISDDTSGALSVGNSAGGYSPWIVWDVGRNYWQASISIGLLNSTGITYTVQHCAGLQLSNNNELIFNDSILTSQTATGTTYLFNENYQASRVLVSAFTSGSIRMITRAAANNIASAKSTYFAL